MKLTGDCPSCGQTHTLALTTTETDAGDVLELAAGDLDTTTGVLPASPELLRALAEAGAIACPATPRGRTVGHGGPGIIYT